MVSLDRELTAFLEASCADPVGFLQLVLLQQSPICLPADELLHRTRVGGPTRERLARSSPHSHRGAGEESLAAYLCLRRSTLPRRLE